MAASMLQVPRHQVDRSHDMSPLCHNNSQNVTCSCEIQILLGCRAALAPALTAICGRLGLQASAAVLSLV